MAGLARMPRKERKERSGQRGKDGEESLCFRLGRKGKECSSSGVAKHMENYSFYKSSFSPLNDEIKFSRTDSSQNSGAVSLPLQYSIITIS